jgi:hypothetical protein
MCCYLHLRRRVSLHHPLVTPVIILDVTYPSHNIVSYLPPPYSVLTLSFDRLQIVLLSGAIPLCIPPLYGQFSGHEARIRVESWEALG